MGSGGENNTGEVRGDLGVEEVKLENGSSSKKEIGQK